MTSRVNRRALFRAFYLVTAYVLLAKLGLQIRAVTGFSSLYWLPSGLTLAALTLWGRSYWPVVVLASFILGMSEGRTWNTSLLLGGAHAIDPLLGSFFLQRFGAQRPTLSRVREVLVLIILSAFAANFVAVSFEMLAIWATSPVPAERLLTTFRAWWLSQSLGSFIVGGAIVAWVNDISPRFKTVRPKWDAYVYAGLALAICWINYTPYGRQYQSLLLRPYMLSFLMICAALRYELVGAVSMALIQLGASCYGALAGYIAFKGVGRGDAYLLWQLIVMVCCATGFIIAAARRELEAAVDARDEFLGVASHELKTPLTSLSLQLQLAERRVEAAVQRIGVSEHPEMTRLSSSIHSSLVQVGRLKALVEELLDVSRIQAGKLSFHFRELDLEKMLQDVVDRRRDELAVAKCSIQVEIQSGLKGFVDCSRIEQVLENLLSNAIKYAPGKPIRLSARERNGRTLISVRDFGPGIPGPEQARIFGKFERSVSTQNHVPGLGLGLFIVRSIVEGHGGLVTLDSEENRGATFTIDLPGPVSAGLRLGLKPAAPAAATSST